MKIKTRYCLGLFCLITTLLGAQTNHLTTLLQQGLFEEQANRNLDAAIVQYQALATQFDQDRQIAATAVFRLGECYRAQGKTNEAVLQYQRLLHDFADQQILVTMSRQNLTGLGVSSEPAATAGRQQQKDLLAKQIALAERDLADAQVKVQIGKAPPADIRVAQQHVLQLQQQLAALDAPQTAAPDESVPAITKEWQEIKRVEQMIQDSPDLINKPDSDRQTPLTKAVTAGQIEVVRFLLDHGADINGAGYPINVAVKSGNRTMVELLIKRGAKIDDPDDSPNRSGTTPLYLAVQGGYQTITEVLLANHAKPNPFNSGFTPLHYATQDGQDKLVKTLLAAGAKINCEDTRGQTPLSLAVKSGSLETVKTLLAGKADPNQGTLNAPLLAAIVGNNLAMAELLLQAGANPNQAGNVDVDVFFKHASHSGGSSRVAPLYLAVQKKQLPMVQLLLKFKADPNESETDGRSVLFSAIYKPEILTALLEAGANPEVRDETDSMNNNLPRGGMGLGTGLPAPPLLISRTPLLFAAGAESNAVAVATLLQYGANPNATDRQGNNALYYAAEALAEEKTFVLLLEHHTNPNQQNKEGHTPLDQVKEMLRTPTGDASSRFLNYSYNTHLTEVPLAQKTLVQNIIALLHQYGALDQLPDWQHLSVSRPAAKFYGIVFNRETNDWNHFTLFEMIYNAGRYGDQLNYADLTKLVVVRPAANGTNFQRIAINLLNATNGVDTSRDMPLEFGDVLEIPEREHSLSDSLRYLNSEHLQAIEASLFKQAGQAKLVVAGGKTVDLPLQTPSSPTGTSFSERLEHVRRSTTYSDPILTSFLQHDDLALHALTSNCDLSRVKVTHKNSKTSQTQTWLIDCSDPNRQPKETDLWLRDGDVIEVPLKSP